MDFITIMEQNCVTDKIFCLFFTLQCLLRRASPTDSDAFSFLKADNEDCVTYSGFCKALQQVKCLLEKSLL
jgi:hypothetical protein